MDVIDVKKSYGKKQALKGVSFSVYKGDIFGIVGPNGAGKTTLLRIISGIITEYEGNVRIMNLSPFDARKRGLISYLPEEASPYERLTGMENLLFFAKLYGKGDERRATEMARIGAEISSLGDRVYERTSEYSRGMKRRLLISRTIMTNPIIAVLDEPMSGLDVESAVRIRRKIRDEVSNKQTTVIFSSHDMLEIELLCTRLVMLNEGEIVAEGTPRELKERFNAADMEEAFLKATGGRID